MVKSLVFDNITG